MRYQAQISLESENVVDPNVDKNPLIENAGDENPGVEPTPSITEPEDVSLDTSPEIEGCKDTVETDPQIREIKKELDNAHTEADKCVEASDALAAISVEMMALVNDHGKLTSGELFVLNRACQSIGNESLPISMESLTTDGMLYTGTMASCEGLLNVLLILHVKLIGYLERLLRAINAQIKARTPKLNALIARGLKLKEGIDNSRREAGLKEITGDFVTKLSVDGKSPDPSTLIKTANTLVSLSGETLSTNLVKGVDTYMQQMVNGINANLSTDLAQVERPSGWLTFFGWFFIPGALGTIFLGSRIWSGSKQGQEDLRLDPNTILPIFKMCPTAAKINSDKIGVFDVRRSPDLFDGYVVTASELSANQKASGKVSLRDVNAAISLERNVAAGTGTTIRALTGSEQAEVCDLAISLLTSVRNYYKDYPVKSKAYMNAVNGSFGEGSKLYKTMRADGAKWTGFCYRGAMHLFTRGYLGGVIGSQNDIAEYATRTARALLALVEASSNAAKANIAGSVSQEDANPFL